MKENRAILKNFQFHKWWICKHSRFSLMKKTWIINHRFRIIWKKFWTSDNHVSINEQLIEFRKRFVHTMQLICEAIEVNFKLYNLCQDKYLIVILLIFKIVKVLLFDHFYQRTGLNSIRKEQGSNSYKNSIRTISFSLSSLNQYSLVIKIN
jgi:hypothetical protein